MLTIEDYLLHYFTHFCQSEGKLYIGLQSMLKRANSKSFEEEKRQAELQGFHLVLLKLSLSM